MTFDSLPYVPKISIAIHKVMRLLRCLLRQ